MSAQFWRDEPGGELTRCAGRALGGALGVMERNGEYSDEGPAFAPRVIDIDRDGCSGLSNSARGCSSTIHFCKRSAKM